MLCERDLQTCVDQRQIWGVLAETKLAFRTAAFHTHWYSCPCVKKGKQHPHTRHDLSKSMASQNVLQSLPYHGGTSQQETHKFRKPQTSASCRRAMGSYAIGLLACGAEGLGFWGLCVSSTESGVFAKQG